RTATPARQAHRPVGGRHRGAGLRRLHPQWGDRPMSDAPATATSRSAGLPRLIGVAVAVFLLTFSLVPLYRIACERCS
ncbi:hypothetical protein HMPREF0549_0559, partial [Limosilactobacillus vaginalis DSM 5837 = ATCC 49540]